MYCTCYNNLGGFSLKEEKPILFVLSQWQPNYKPSIYYFLYRWAIAIYFFSTFVISIANTVPDVPHYQVKWLIYLTDWGYTMCTLQSIAAVTIVTGCYIAHKSGNSNHFGNKTLYFYQVYWVLHTIALDLACAITVMYWSFIFDPKTAEVSALNVIAHGMNSAMMFVDFWIISHPFRLLHFIYTVSFALVYAVFSGIYYAAGGTSREGFHYIYSILNWEKPGFTVGVCVGVTAFLIVIHVIFFGLYHLRLKLQDTFGIAHKKKVNQLITDILQQKTGYDNQIAIDKV